MIATGGLRADREMPEGALRLRAPIMLRGHLDRPETVGLDPRRVRLVHASVRRRSLRACPEKVARLFQYLDIGYIRCLMRTCSKSLNLSCVLIDQMIPFDLDALWSFEARGGARTKTGDTRVTRRRRA